MPEREADAKNGHCGAEVRGPDVAAGARDVAVVGEGVDDGAGTAEVGGGGGVVFAFWEGKGEEGGGFGGFGGGMVIHVGVVFGGEGSRIWDGMELVVVITFGGIPEGPAGFMLCL